MSWPSRTRHGGLATWVRRRGWVLLLALFVLTRSVFFVSLRPWDQSRRDTHFIVSDAGEYYWTAHNLLAGRNYSSSPHEPYPPDALRTPLYPLFLAAIIRGVGDSVVAIVSAQMVLQLVTIALIYVGAQRLFSALTAFWLALYSVFDPVYLVMSGVFYTETLYQLLNVLCVYALIRGLTMGFTPVRLCVTGLLFGLGLLTRPFALYFLPVMGVLVAVSQRTVSAALGKSVLLAACVLAVLFPWVYRNAVVFGAWSMSSVDGASLQKFYMAPFLAAREHRSLAEARAQLAAETPAFDNPFDRVAFVQRQTARIIREHPLDYMAFHLRSAWPALTGSNSEALGALLSEEGPGRLDGGSEASGGHPPRDAPWRRALVGGNMVLLGALYGFFMLGLWRLWGRRDVLIMALLIAGVAYLPAVTGPMSSSRYRLSIVPLLLYGAGIGLRSLERTPEEPGRARSPARRQP